MKIKGHHNKQLQQLAKKVLNGSASESEISYLKAYYDLFDNHNEAELSDTDAEGINRDIKARLLASTHQQPFKQTKIITLPRIAAVLGLFLMALVCVYKYRKGGPDKVTIAVIKPKAQPIAYGSNKAILTLANGTQIILDGRSKGKLAKEADVDVTKAANGVLTYSNAPKPRGVMPEIFNTMQTPRGGIYRVQLPDGTNVWLNSATILRYPVAFNGKERKVTLDGEAYFEVAHDANHPFMVSTQNQTVEVLGTHFNVNSYSDDDIAKTTLLEGSVRIAALGLNKSGILKPGQQAIINQQKINIKNIDTQNAIAWKNGLFVFDNENIQAIMKKISRWYDVDVEYMGELDNIRFGGSVSRFTDIQQLLRKLELTNTIHFKINGRRIIVMK
ncbi:MAG: FecR domain-containing protein [Mucilaginibacter sp.]|uniref:FecR family protein n=1 Tax=Mucilaginibacter sp. TaxID=1882438 RepID=UPI003265D8F0